LIASDNNIAVFKKESNLLRLVTTTHANLKEKIIVEGDNNKERIIFKTKSGQIGELPIIKFENK
jgi:hypothetical protein